MSYYGNILEEELKLKVARDLFTRLDCTQIIGRVDFCVSLPADPLGPNETESLLWAEAKQGTSHPIEESFIQLIMTLGRERPQDTHLPPMFIGAFDADKIAFLPYNTVLAVLAQNDFDWTSRPSDHQSKEFRQLHQLLSDTLHNGMETYYYERDAQELMHFIRHHFLMRHTTESHIRINKNNFVAIYLKWLQQVKPTIAINWQMARQEGIIDADFYLADILSEHNTTLSDRLFVLLRDERYYYNMQRRATGALAFETVDFTDQRQAHRDFWQRYARPPRREYWDYIVNRRDLLVPQDVRERKGSFFTPARWVELSQQYIAAELGENWQEEYYVWDCCAGTGNLLAGLQNKYNIYASTLDEADVSTMKQRIQNGANLLENHVFQFDFLNDPLLDETDKNGNVTKKSKLPDTLQDIIRDPEKRRKLVVYINPPYAEASNARQRSGTGSNRPMLAKDTLMYKKYVGEIGTAARELFAQFFIRVHHELPTAMLAEFSTLKILQASNFREFRREFRAKPGRNFCVPANTFDNVTGKFPIGFFIWHTDDSSLIQETRSDFYQADGTFLYQKTLTTYDNQPLIIKWLQKYYDKTSSPIGYQMTKGTDIQNNNGIYISNWVRPNDIKKHMFTPITAQNLIPMCIYTTIRHCIEADWYNDRDQYLSPNEGWLADIEFQADCLIYATLCGFNNVTMEHGTNHWIPFTEDEVDAQEKFESHFMSDYLKGKHTPSTAPACAEGELFAQVQSQTDALAAPKLQFSAEAQAVLDAGRELWRYYHRQPIARERPNASFYDIRLYFQGTKTTRSGKQQMNTESQDATYTSLIANLRQKQKELARKIEPKVYEYGFLKK